MKAAATGEPKPEPLLGPNRIIEELFALGIDRDETASQLCVETLLTLSTNEWHPPADEKLLVSPKVERFAIRSLAVGVNFLAGQGDGLVAGGTATPDAYGELLSRGRAVAGSSNLDLAHEALLGLVDPDTQKAHHGNWLLRPFHESLLWYDARRSPAQRGGIPARWGVRKAHMRGGGITLARLLLDPPSADVEVLGRRAVDAIHRALTASSPLADISDVLESGLSAGHARAYPTEESERRSWRLGGDPRLGELARRVCRHAEGVMLQNGASDPAKLWQLRSVLALDVAVHVLQAAWSTTETPAAEQYLLLAFGGGARAADPVRQRSERILGRVRVRFQEAVVLTLANQMRELGTRPKPPAWSDQFELRQRKKLGTGDDEGVASQLAGLRHPAPREKYLELAQAAAESADYGRAELGFRRLLDSVGLLAGGSTYRYTSPPPELLGALVGALSARMPMSSTEFYSAIRDEWGLVVDQESAEGTDLETYLDGAQLERNGRRAERLLTSAGLAVGLSDRTTLVGEQSRRVDL